MDHSDLLTHHWEASSVGSTSVVVEVKAIDHLLPIHHAQVISYLKLSGCSVGLLINFHAATLKDGIRRFVNRLPHPSASSPFPSAPLR